jgi:hypothetical protein
MPRLTFMELLKAAPPRDGETLLLQSGAQRGSNLDRVGVIDLGKEIDILGDPGDETMGDHHCAASEGECAGFRQVQGCPRDALS